jgi:hypothetical protein
LPSDREQRDDHSLALAGENGVTTASDYFIELVCRCDVGIMVGWTPITSLTTASTKFDAAAIVVGRDPNVRLGYKAEVVCATRGRRESFSSVVNGIKRAERVCVRRYHNGCNDRKDRYKSNHDDYLCKTYSTVKDESNTDSLCERKEEATKRGRLCSGKTLSTFLYML